MNVKALGIFLPAPLSRGRSEDSRDRLGVLFQYALAPDVVTTRFVADEEFIDRDDAPTLSVAYLAESPSEQQALWRDVRSAPLNGRFSNKNGWLLPAFFQNLLPEGVFRDHVAAQRGCDPKDHFEMLAACGKDLPGGLYALPVELSRDELARYVTQHNDALEMSVTADPLDEGVSLSGVQPKVAAIKEGNRYVGRTKEHDTHVIVKLPVVGQPMLPELEDLSLRLAKAAGVNACAAYLEPLETLAIEHGYDLGDANAKTQFLAVPRFDRTPQGRVHCEDFAQVFNVMPEDKYGVVDGDDKTSYLDIAAVLLSFDSMGEAAVHELLRRLVVNELLGNPDMHLKNIGLLYTDGRTPVLSPAYDIVAYAAFAKNQGHALALLPVNRWRRSEAAAQGQAKPKQTLSPAVVRVFTEALGIPEKPAATVIRETVKKAFTLWPALIASSSITAMQKERLAAHVNHHPMMQSLARRAA